MNIEHKVKTIVLTTATQDCKQLSSANCKFLQRHHQHGLLDALSTVLPDAPPPNNSPTLATLLWWNLVYANPTDAKMLDMLMKVCLVF